MESAAQQASGSTFGLRINLSEEITNLSGQTWGTFTMDLDDASVVSESANGQHPGFAHFHPAPVIAVPPFFVTTPNNGDKASSLLFENGNMINGETDLWGTFGLHQYEDDGVNRSFTLVETPFAAVPEPSTFALAAIGAVAVIAFTRRRFA